MTCFASPRGRGPPLCPACRPSRWSAIPRGNGLHDFGRIWRQDPLRDVRSPERKVRPFADHLALGIAVDFPDQISEVSGELLEKWGVTFDEALEIGRDNLWKRSAGKWEHLAEGVWMSPWQDNLDVNRLAMPTLFRQLTVDGDPIAFAPNRDHLIVTGSRNFVGQGVAAAYAIGLLDEPRPMNATPIILDGLEWKAYPFDTNHPIASLFRRLQIRSLSEDYATQKSILVERFEREERDIFVASFMAFENKEK